MKDTNHDVLKDYVTRLKKEAALKSLLCALAIGCGALLLTSLICWFTEFGGYWIYPVAFIVPFGAAMPLFYFFVFYPTKKYVARRLDKLGLDERILTMVEFENQDSYIMQRQREDAVATLSKFNSGLVKFALSAALIAVPAIAVPTATAMTTVDALAKAEVIDSGKDLIEEANRDKTAFELVYRIPDEMKGLGLLYSASNPGGTDEITITVGKGKDGEIVLPIAANGYVFVRWSDGVGDVLRKDSEVQGKIIVNAIFDKIGYEAGNDSKEDYGWPDILNKGEDGDDSDRRPSSSEPGDSRKPWEPVDEDKDAGGGDDTTQFIIDGKTDYAGQPYQEAYDKIMDKLNQSGGSDGSYNDIIADYFESIKRN